MDELVDPAVIHKVLSILLDRDMDRVGIAEEIVHVAQNLLIGTGHKDAEIVLIITGRMEFQNVFHIAHVDELVDPAVAVAGDIGKGAPADGLFVQAMDRHDGKQLTDGPAVRDGLKYRQITDIGVGKLGFKAFQFFRHVFLLAHDPEDLPAGRPEDGFHDAAVLQCQVAEFEEAQRLVAKGQGVVIGLLKVFDGD